MACLLALPSLGWLTLCTCMLPYWLGDDSYSYGWAVLPVGTVLAWLRLRDAPSPSQDRLADLLVAFIVPVLLAVIGIARLVLLTNPDWRTPLYAGGVAAVALGYAALMKGGGWSWVKHFSWVALFPITMLPWPAAWERDIVEPLFDWTAAGAVCVASLCGVKVWQVGNVVMTHAGGFGVEEACSGIRSLQAVPFIVLAACELHRVTAFNRIVTLALTTGSVLVLNAMRAALLVLTGTWQGTSVASALHDTAGLLTSVAGILFCVWCARTFHGREVRSPCVEFARPGTFRTVEVYIGLLVLVGPLILYLQLPPGAPEIPRVWQFRTPNAEGIKLVELHPAVQRVLKHDESIAFEWRDPESARHLVFYGFIWRSGNAAAIPARVHAPEICIPAQAGMTFTGYGSTVSVSVGLESVEFRQLRFSDGRRKCTVLSTAWDDRLGWVDGMRMPSIEERWGRVKNGGRTGSYASIQLVVAGTAASKELEKIASAAISQAIK